MEKGELITILGASIIIILLILTFVFQNTDTYVLSWVVFFGAILGALFLVYVITTSDVTWAKILSKTFFIIPILVAVGFLLFWGIKATYNEAKNSFVEFSDFLPWVFLWGLFILIYTLEILLFIKIDKTKDSLLKVLTWMVGVSIYFVTGVIGAAIISPPSFGTYGTPLYKPKVK